MADMITRCPKCGTAFRISDALLKSAKGVVRCGSCLSVFNAREHLEAKPAPVPPARETHTPPAKSPPPAPAPEPPTKAGPVIEPEPQEDPSERWRLSEPEESLFERPRPKFQEEPEEDDDEAWALELLKDDSDLNIRFKKVSDKPAAAPPPQPAAPVAAPAPTRASPTPPPSPARAPAPPAPPTTAPPASEPVAVPAPEVATQTPEPQTETAPAPAAPVAEPAAAPAAPPKRKPIRPRFEPKSVPLEQVIAALEPEPLELDWQQPGSWKKRLLWPLLVLLALACLAIQVAWLEFDRLNRIEPYRSVYGVACRMLGCALPELRDPKLIQTSNLVVRTSPELEGVLQVDVILQNNAPFEQAFPKIQLTFTNLQNEPVATRLLQPAEYLGGELAGRDKMPVRQPIHIGLEIADPGSDAASYFIAIVD